MAKTVATGTRKTTSWLAGVMREVEELVASKAFTEPMDPIAEKDGHDLVAEDQERVIGSMTPTMKALYTLWQQEGQRFMEVTFSILNPGNHDKIDVLGPEALRAKARTDALQALFWAEVRNEFPESLRGCGLGVRKGFKIVQLLPPRGGHLVVLGLEELRTMMLDR